MEQLSFEFVGVTNEQVTLDPEEYRGMTRGEVSASIMRTLAEIAPNVSFWEPDIEWAADDVCSVLQRNEREPERESGGET
jgi:hypothetical protein